MNGSAADARTPWWARRPSFRPAREFRILLLSTALAGSLAGCAGYRVGSLLPPEIQTVAVPTFENRTTEPLLENVVTDAVIRELQTEGTLRIVPEAQADCVLRGTITDYQLVPLRYSRSDRAVPSEYRAVITAAFVLENARTGTEITARPMLYGEYDFPIGGDLITSETRAKPEAALDLAHDIVEGVVEAW